MSEADDTVKIRQSKMLSWSMLLLAAASSVVTIYLACFMFTRSAHLDWAFYGLFGTASVFLGLAIWRGIRMVFLMPDEIVILSPAGFTDLRKTAVPISWREVLAITMESEGARPFTSYKIIRVELEKTAADIADEPAYTVTIANSAGNPKMFNVRVAGLRIDGASLLKLFQQYFAKYGPAATRNSIVLG